MAELFAGEDAGNVHLDDRDADSSDGVGDGDRRVGVGSGVHYDPVVGVLRCVQLVDQFSFDVGLVIVERDVRKPFFQFVQVRFEGLFSVDTLFALSQQVQVRAVNNQ